MTLPPELRPDAVRALGVPDNRDAAPQGHVTSPGDRSIRKLVRRAAVRTARPVVHRVAHLVRRWATESVRHDHEEALARIGRLERRLFENAGATVDLTELTERLRGAEINQTLQKAEFSDVLRRFEDLGSAIAPGTGIGGAAIRLAEQREQLHSLDRRLRVLDARVVSAASSTAEPVVAAEGAARPSAASATTEDSPGFDYLGFERRFRGDPEEILRVQRDRYVPLLAGHGPVVDVGCGRGELLSALTDEGIECIGVEPEPGMAAEAKARGMVVEQTDALGFLRAREPGSIGAVFSAHVVEHLELDYLLEYLHLSASRLAPGGLFIAETPNPASLIVLGNSYILDPTHVWPLHPSLMAFLCESAGFHEIKFLFHAPATGYQLPLAAEVDSSLARVVNDGFSRLNDVLFGPQDYTIIATKGSD